MKVVTIKELNEDEVKLEELKKKKAVIEHQLKMVDNSIRSIIYKYDTCKIDYSSR